MKRCGKKHRNPLYFFKGENMKLYTYFGYRHGKLTTVVTSIMDDGEDAINCNYYIAEPRDAEKQIEEWKKEHTA